MFFLSSRTFRGHLTLANRQKNVDRQGASSGGKACVILVKRRRGVDNGLSIGTGLRKTRSQTRIARANSESRRENDDRVRFSADLSFFNRRTEEQEEQEGSDEEDIETDDEDNATIDDIIEEAENDTANT